jgi:translation initiation factor 1
MKKNKNSSLVYSSGSGRMCPTCGKPQGQCVCKKSQPTAKSDGIVRVGRQTKGRKGKGVTIISGVPLTGDRLQELAKKLKQKCGTGGTVKNGVIEIQGEHRDTLLVELEKEGYTVKRAGG